jgi:integrase
MPRGKQPTGLPPFEQELLDLWTKDMIVVANRARNTIKTYRKMMIYFCRYINGLGKELSNIEATDIVDYLKLLVENREASYQTISFSTLKSFYDWMFSTERMKNRIMLSVTNPVRPKRVVQQYVPSFPELMKMRTRLGSREIRVATMFELLLTSGLRDNELAQLRVGDIKFGVSVNDLETKRQSVYCGGKIEILIDRMNVKYGSNHTTYFSVLAGKLLKKHIQHYGLSDPRMPLFPWAESTRRLDLESALNEFVISSGNDITERKHGFKDLVSEIDSIPGVSNQFKKLIQKRARQSDTEVTRLGATPRDMKQIKAKKYSAHQHCFRRAFTCIQYYRSYYGSMRDLAAIKSFLGHTNLEAMSNYLLELNLITDRSQWNMIMLGKPGDYRALLHS